MPAQYQMNAVIRRIDASQRKSAAAEGLIIDLPGSTGFFSRKSQYLIIVPRDGMGSARCKIDLPVEAPERKWMLQLEVNLAVQFAGGGPAEARKLVTAIHEADNPDKALQSLVRAWASAFLKEKDNLSKAGFIEAFFSLRQPLKAHIIAAALTVALVVSEIEIKIRGEEAVSEVIEIKLSDCPVVLQDYKPEVALTVDADLSRLRGSILPYIEIDSEQTIAAEIRRELRDQFRTQVKLHAFQFDENGQVKTVASQVVRRIAENHGREIARLMISRAAPFEGLQTTAEIKLPEEKFKQLDYPDPVQVDVDLKLTLVDLGELSRSKINADQLGAWARTIVRETISRRLLGVNYVDLFPQYEEKLKETIEAVASAARSIGYVLSRFVVQTNLDFQVLQRGFDCRIENAKFPLRLRECEVALDIETLLRITDKEVLQGLFTKNTAITQTITDTIRNAAARALRSVSPEEFYLHFYGAADPTNKSVAERLELEIQQDCEKFKPEGGFKVNITQRSDELSEVYRALVRSEISHQELCDDNTKLAVSVKASVSSISINNWHQFQERKPRIEKVAASFESHVISFLYESAKRNLKQLMNTPSPVVCHHAEQWVNERLAKEYGLGIQIHHWLLTDTTAGLPYDTWEDKIRKLSAALIELNSELARRSTDDTVSDGEINTLKKRIKEVENLRDEAYQERGAPGTIFKNTAEQFQIEGGSDKLLGSGSKSKAATPGESN